MFRALLRLEWERRRRFLLASIGGAWALGAVALVAFPSIRNGSMSGEIVFLATVLFGAVLASDAFAKDAGNGGLEFLFANGAGPGRLFLARALVVAGETAAFSLCLLAAETARLKWTTSAPMADRWVGEKLTILAMHPREALALYLLPALGTFLLVSAVSNRTSVALGVGAAAVVAVVCLDRYAAAHADVAARQRVVSALGSAALVPASIALAAAAVFVRRVEPERTRPRAILAVAGAVVLAIRFASISAAGDARVGGDPVACAIAVSPDGRRVAVEGASLWRPGPAESWAVGSLGRALEPGPVSFGERVAVATIGRPSRLVSPLPVRLESSPEVPAWVSERHLRLRGQDPSTDCPALTRESALLFDAERGMLRQAPTVFLLDTDGAEHQMRWKIEVPSGASPADARLVVKTWSGDAELRDDNGDGEIELARIADDRSLRVQSNGSVVLVDGEGQRTRVWPLQ